MTSTLRARVLDALPGYRQQEHRHDQLRAMHQNIPTAPGAFANVDKSHELLGWSAELTLDEAIASALAWGDRRKEVLGYE